MSLKFSNNATSVLASGIIATDTTISVAVGDGSKFPTLAAGDWFPAVLVDASANREVIKVTARSSDVLTVVRAQEGTVARSYSAGDRIDLRMTAGAFEEFLQAGLNLGDVANPVIARTNLGLATVANTGDANDLLNLLAAVLATGIATTNGFTTGDIKATLKTAADSGWVFCDDGTIGDASSGATTRANADCLDLYTLLWTNVSNTYAPVTGGRGVSAAADWGAHKPIALTKMLGRALAAAGAGSGLSARTLGETAGEETHALSSAEMAAHTHPQTAQQPTFTYSTAGVQSGGSFPGVYNIGSGTYTQTTTADATPGDTGSTGGGVAHNNMQPTSFVNFMIKL